MSRYRIRRIAVRRNKHWNTNPLLHFITARRYA